MGNTYYITSGDAKTILLDFSKDYTNKKYCQKISYQEWRDLTQGETLYINVEFDNLDTLYNDNNSLTTDHIKNFYVSSDDNEQNYVFSPKDSGFGEYLYWNYYRSICKASKNAISDAAQKNVMQKMKRTLKNDKTVMDTIIVPTEETTSGLLYNLNNSLMFSLKTDSTTIELPHSAVDTLMQENNIQIKDLNGNYRPLADIIDDIAKIWNKNKKENNKMTNLVNFKFGPMTSNDVRMSMYGMAVMSHNGTWVAYDKNTNSVMDVDIFNIDAENMFYMIPVSLNQITYGDVIMHNDTPMFVTSVQPDGSLMVVDPAAGESKTILPTKSCFGFNFATKVFSLFEGMGMSGAMAPSADNPFGNLGMFMVMSEIMKDNDSNSKNNFKKFMPFMMMSAVNAPAGDGSAQANPMGAMMNNPFVLMALMGN